jgi:hypothetical protein
MGTNNSGRGAGNGILAGAISIATCPLIDLISGLGYYALELPF